MARPDGEAFLFYFERWRGSRPVQRMSFAERGMFVEMLIEQWMRGDLPDNPQAVADAIATSDPQVGEIHAAWPALRRQFISVDGASTPRMQNLVLERVRSDRDAYVRWRKKLGRLGGEARAKRIRDTHLTPVPSVTRPQAGGLPEPSYRTGLDGMGLDRMGSDRRASPRAHTGTVFEGSLPREHVSHVFCDPSFAVCVPAPVHAKLIGNLSRRFGGDRAQAHQALLAWYPTVPPQLAETDVMGDAFKFWQRHFDAAFATTDTPVSPSADQQAATYQAKVRADADAVLKLVQQDDAKKAGAR